MCKQSHAQSNRIKIFTRLIAALYYLQLFERNLLFVMY